MVTESLGGNDLELEDLRRLALIKLAAIEALGYTPETWHKDWLILACTQLENIYFEACLEAECVEDFEHTDLGDGWIRVQGWLNSPA